MNDYPRAQERSPPEGRVIRILERAHDTIVGTLQQSKNFFYVVPDDPRIVHNVYVQVPPQPPLAEGADRGDKVVVRLEPWESRHVNPEGQIIEVLGPSSAPGVDMLSIIRKYHLPTEFPQSVLEEAQRIPETVDAGNVRRTRGSARRNSSSRSIRTMRAISTTRSMSSGFRRRLAASVCTSPTLPPT